MPDLRQAAYNEEQKLAAKQIEYAIAPPVSPLFVQLSQAGVPVHAASIIGSEIGNLLERIKVLEARLQFFENGSRKRG